MFGGRGSANVLCEDRVPKEDSVGFGEFCTQKILTIFIKEGATLFTSCVFSLAPIRSNIPVEEFPDYVMEMMSEDQYESSCLAREFSVRLQPAAE